MFAKKGSASPTPPRIYRKELEYLYARRTAIDTLIESLEEYDRFRAIPGENSKQRKTA
ncbi:MAG: hypothetical protein JWP63_2770 [Candidatus Solibacter sp.]|jgi:hypothetical protein|nr:hypothetical protein [Candidatus Solibacter sp.]